MKSIMVIIGTRPEAIKMAPLVLKLKAKENIKTIVCSTGQHKEILEQVLSFFGITPDINLDIMKKNQDLFSITSSIMNSLKRSFKEFNPDLILVHGDTTTAFSASLAAFYSGIKIGHVEAGLRTWNLKSPFPEEFNRQSIGKIANYHFSPTVKSEENLKVEGIKANNILTTGNTVIDALKLAVAKLENYQSEPLNLLKALINKDHRIVLVTAHRRENHGMGIQNICKALKVTATNFSNNVTIVIPVHPNPKVKEVIEGELSEFSNIILVEALGYPEFIWLMNVSHIILTDSGGVQEEAPSLGKPVLVMREETERPEAVECGTVKLVGTNSDIIEKEVSKLLTNQGYYSLFSNKMNPYGDGESSERIVKFLQQRGY